MTTASILPGAIVADLSHWDPKTEPQFEAARAAGLIGVITKLTQGGHLDQTAVSILYNAWGAGIRMLGVYDFGDASDDVQAFCAALVTEFQGKSDGVLMALDAEHNPASQMTVAVAEDWTDAAHDKFGRWPTLYMGRSGPDGTGEGLPSAVLSNCDLWLPAYGPHADNLGDILPPGFRLPTSDADRGGCLRLWQFTDGSINGGPMSGLGAVDQSYPIGFSCIDAFAAWWGK